VALIVNSIQGYQQKKTFPGNWVHQQQQKEPEFRPEFFSPEGPVSEWKEWNRFLGGTWHLRSPTRSPQEKPVQGPSFSARLNTMQGTFRNLEEVPTPKTNMTTKNCAI